VNGVDLHDLAGAYALHALPDLERARYERHLETCTACRAEVLAHLEVAALLGEAVECTPPPGLRGRVLAEVSALAPPPPPLAPVVLAAPAPAQQARRPGWLAPVAAALAAAAVAVGVTLAGVTLAERPEGPADRVAALLAAEGAVVVPFASDGAVEATLVAAPGQGDAAVVIRDLPEDEGTWTLWTVRDGAPVWEQPLDPGEPIAVLDDVEGASAVAVSLEPDAERAEAPRGPVLAQAELPQP